MSSATTWVDRLHMKPTASSKSTSSPKAFEFNIASFNVLAESYLSPRSHPGLPPSYADVAFDRDKRRKLLIDTLKRFCCPANDVNAGSRNDKWDIFALQELDLIAEDEEVLPALKSWGYEVVHTPTDQRRDCCAIVYDVEKFRLVKNEVVRFDDLATLYANKSDESTDSTTEAGPDGNTKLKEGTTFNNIKPNSTNSELTGMVRSFLRRNCAIIAHLETIGSSSTTAHENQSILVASVHLYWHPGYEYVKLCQAKYLLDRAHTMSLQSKSTERMPTIICGDMNSKPGSIVHQYFVKGDVDARSVAPWHYFWNADDEVMYTEDSDDVDDRLDGQDEVVAGVIDGDSTAISAGADESNNAATPSAENGQIPSLENQFQFCQFLDSETSNNAYSDMNNSNHVAKNDTTTTYGSNGSKEDIDRNYKDLQETLAARRMGNHTSPQDYTHQTPTAGVKYMLDFTLNRFTRWLRILGIDARLETDEEEKDRTTGKNIALFDHCKQEGRTLLTTSYKLLLRKDCPPGAYLLDPKSIRHLEEALPRLLRTHGVELSPRTFLTRCVVCNGNINRVSNDDEKRTIFVEHGAPDLVNTKEDMEVFKCDKCSQGYWWDDRPSSSASRVFEQTTKLFRLCLRGGVRIKNQSSSDETTQKETMGAFDFVDVKKECEYWELNNSGTDLAVIEWLREDKLSNPFRLRSAYCSSGGGDSAPLFIGESLPFSNVTSEFVGLLDYVFYDNQFEQVCQLNVPTSFRDMNASEVPQGHLIPSNIWPSDHLAVGAKLRLKPKPVKNAPAPISHPPRCACGCVPNILSLFEMAELRKKAREAAKANKSTP